MSLFGSEPKTGKITVVAQIRAKSGHEDEVRKGIRALVEPTRKEAGCLKYELFEDVYYTGSLMTIEEWESEAALDVHLEVNKAALNKSKALLREDLKISVLRVAE